MAQRVQVDGRGVMEAEDPQGQSHRTDPEQESRREGEQGNRGAGAVLGALSPGAVTQIWGKGIRKETLSSPSAHGLTAPHTQRTPWG